MSIPQPQPDDQQLGSIDYAAGFDDGYMAGWTSAAPTIEARDELIARRVVALQYDHAHPLSDDVTSYIDRHKAAWARWERNAERAPLPTYQQAIDSWQVAS